MGEWERKQQQAVSVRAWFDREEEKKRTERGDEGYRAYRQELEGLAQEQQRQREEAAAQRQREWEERYVPGTEAHRRFMEEQAYRQKWAQEEEARRKKEEAKNDAWWATARQRQEG
jgi:hypothetical protein